MTKIISIADDVYDYLKSCKDKDESFSKVIRRMVPKEKKESILDFAGILKDDKDFARVMDEVIASRKNFKSKNIEF